MVRQFAAADSTQRTFVIQPNRSMSWRGLVTIFALMATFVIGIGVFCFCFGLPFVLPFSGLDAILLGAALYVTAWRGGQQEVVTVGEDAVAVEAGRTEPEWREEFQRYWARILLEHPGGWYPSRLLIRSHGRQVEIGRFLNEQERQGLAEQLWAAMKQRRGSARPEDRT